jgi:DUF4097 and DUF4098 domain-containing protein YvlB
MSKGSIIFIYVAIALILIGAIIFALVMSMNDWDFGKLSTVRYETNEYEITEDFSNISIISNTADVELIPTEDEKTTVSCYEEENLRHSVSVKDGRLTVEVMNTKKWYQNIGITYTSPKIKIYLPKSEYKELYIKLSTGAAQIPEAFTFESIGITMTTGAVTCKASATGDIKIKASTGAIHLEGLSADSLELKTTTGSITLSDVTADGNIRAEVTTGRCNLTDVTCKDFASDGDTGDLYMTNVICKEKLTVERDTGDVKLDSCDANEIDIETDTGDVVGSLLSEKIFFAESDTGSVNVPKTTSGGVCEITTDTGKIKIEIK